MLEAKGRTILVHRGDAGSFTITFTGNDKPDDGVAVLFSIKRAKAKNAQVIMSRELTVEDSAVEVDLTREDTAIAEGTYFWDVCILWTDRPWTPMDPEPLIIKEVTHDV